MTPFLSSVAQGPVSVLRVSVEYESLGGGGGATAVWAIWGFVAFLTTLYQLDIRDVSWSGHFVNRRCVIPIGDALY
jgi:hypothetical protein